MKRPAFYFVVLVALVHLSMIFVSIVRCFDLAEADKRCEAKQEIERSLASVTAQAFALYAAEKTDEQRRISKDSHETSLTRKEKKTTTPDSPDHEEVV